MLVGGNSVRVQIDGKYIPWPKVKSSFATPFSAKDYGRDKSIDLYREYITEKLEEDDVDGRV
jgi:hypothetical protein